MRSVKFTGVSDAYIQRMSNRMAGRINRAYDAARLSTCRAKHGAILLQGSRVLAVGVNTNRNDPAYLEQRKPDKPSGISLHAEVAATRIHNDVPNTTLIVVRVMASGLLGDSKPCPECLDHIIFNTNIREVIYSEAG